RPCYVLERHREEGGNLTARRPRIESLYTSLERILGVVGENAEPGPERDLALRRVLGGEIIGRITTPGFLHRPEDERIRMFDNARRLLEERIPLSAERLLDPTARNFATIIRSGDRARHERWVRWN